MGVDDGYTTLVLEMGISILVQPQLAVRFMTAKDGKSLNRVVPMGGAVYCDDDGRCLYGRTAD